MYLFINNQVLFISRDCDFIERDLSIKSQSLLLKLITRRLTVLTSNFCYHKHSQVTIYAIDCNCLVWRNSIKHPLSCQMSFCETATQLRSITRQHNVFLLLLSTHPPLTIWQYKLKSISFGASEVFKLKNGSSNCRVNIICSAFTDRQVQPWNQNERHSLSLLR